MGIPTLKIRRSRHRLIFNIRIPILVIRPLYIETETTPQNVNLKQGNQVNMNVDIIDNVDCGQTIHDPRRITLMAQAPSCLHCVCDKKEFPDSKVNWANMGPIWGRQDPGGPHVGSMNFAIWDAYEMIHVKTFPSTVWPGIWFSFKASYQIERRT